MTKRANLGAAAVACWCRDRVLLLRRAPREAGRNMWTFPGGGLRRGESELEAAVRELEEETGHLASAGDLDLVHQAEVDGSSGSFSVTTFLLQLASTFEPRLSAEHDMAVWSTAEEWHGLALLPSVRHALNRLSSSVRE